MVQAADVGARVRELHDRAVRQLVDAHARRADQPLVLAVRHGLEDPMNIRLLEVLRGFPGPDGDELLETEFAASAELLILGTLHLVLGSPAQVAAAIGRNDPEVERVRRGEVCYSDGSAEATSIRQALGL